MGLRLRIRRFKFRHVGASSKALESGGFGFSAALSPVFGGRP